VVFDVTHSLQLPGAGDGVTTGLAEYIEPLASAGVAAGVDAVFMEVHDDPSKARSDAANALRLLDANPEVALLFTDINVNIPWDRFNFNIGIDNLFDKDPPLAIDPYVQTLTNQYDFAGRFFYLKASVML